MAQLECYKTADNSVIHIVCSFDEHYKEHCVTMLKSLFYYNNNSCFTIHIFHSKLDEKIINSFKYLFKNEKKLKIEFYNVSSEFFRNAPISFHITIATYYRLLIANLLPINITKVLYLDCDILIRNSIKELWDVNIDDYPIAATIAAGMHDYQEQIGMEKQNLYFNAGILLVNVSYWRKNEILDRGIILLQEKQKIINWWDQDILNILFEGNWLPVSLKWNAQPYIFNDLEIATTTVKEFYEIHDYVIAVSDPIIVHYAGGSKPWQFDRKLPFISEYLKFLSHKNKTFLKFKFIQILKKINLIVTRIIRRIW